MVFGPMNRPPKCLKLSIFLGRVIFEEQLKKIHIFSPKSDFRITIVCPSVWNQNPSDLGNHLYLISYIPDILPFIKLYLSAIWSAFATSKLFWLVALYILFSYLLSRSRSKVYLKSIIRDLDLELEAVIARLHPPWNFSE